MDTPDLAKMLHALYQDEWWTRDERLGFTTEVGGIRLMRRSRRP